MAGFGTNLDLFLKLRSGGDLKQYSYLYDCVVSVIPGEISQEDHKRIKEFCRLYCMNLAKKWAECNRCVKILMNKEKHRKWLEASINWPACDTVDLNTVMGYVPEAVSGTEELPPIEYSQELPSISTVEVQPVSTVEVGTSTEKQKRKPFNELSKQQKRRRTSSIMDDNSEEELQFAFISTLKCNGKPLLAKVIEHLCNNPEALPEVSARLFREEKLKTVSEDKSLALCTSLALSKWKYLTLRDFFNAENCAALPSYHPKLIRAKERCYPSDIEVTEAGACIKLQALLDHTVQRILLGIRPIGEDLIAGLKCIWKWGLDGSSSQSNYKQKSSIDGFDDSSIVMISIVPLRLVNGSQTIIWENPAPCSTYYCRPVKFTFTKETAEFIKTEESEMERQISELVSTQCEDAEVSHELHMTMIDGKVANILADVPSSATCPICLAKPSEMNDLDSLASRPLRTDIYKQGLSSLHMKIRCMECLLHISYNLDFQRWSARGSNKALKEAKKNTTQQEFREQTGMLIDIVKQGFGTTNDGNTARRFFEDYEKSSRITGIDENLIFRFSVILQAISSGKKIDIGKFRSYCRETADLYVHLYSWYYMPVSVHKLLMHGADICSHFSVLPIGILLEEASEARNKDFRHLRSSHARKLGRIETNLDVIHGLLISSDPYISLIRPKLCKATQHELLPEAIQLLQLDPPLSDVFEEEESFETEFENLPDPLAIFGSEAAASLVL